MKREKQSQLGKAKSWKEPARGDVPAKRFADNYKFVKPQAAINNANKKEKA